MFMMHISSLLACSVLLASTVLLIWSLKNKGAGTFLGKVVGSGVFVLSLLSILCTSYYGIKHWSQGDFERPMGMRMHMGMPMGMGMGMHRGMMGNMMPHMMGNMGKTDQMDPQKEEDHPSYHSG